MKTHGVSRGIGKPLTEVEGPILDTKLNVLFLGDNGVHSVKKIGPGVWTSTMLFESKKCAAWSLKLNNADFEAQRC